MPDQPGCGCFSGDSTVQTPNGTIFLRDLKLSDHVLTYIPETGLHFSEVKPVCIISKVIVKGDPSNPLTFSGLDLYSIVLEMWRHRTTVNPTQSHIRSLRSTFFVKSL